MAWETTWHIYLDSVGFNINLLIFSLVILGVGLYERRRRFKTSLLWISLLIAFVGIAYLTFHGRIFFYFFPIPLPENPFHPNLIVNYLLTSTFTFVFFPLLFLRLSNRLDIERLGLKIRDVRYTVRLTFIGTCGILLLSMLPIVISILVGWSYKWPFNYTTLGLTLWFILVTGVSTWMQVFFFLGILFCNYVNSENSKLLFLILTLTFLMFTPLSIFTPFFVTGLGIEAYMTLKTGNVYGAMLTHSLGVAVNTILVMA